MRHRALTAREKDLLAPYVAAIDLDNALIHDGQVPWYLSRRFAAIVRGNHIYLRPGVYDSLTVEGVALLGHELTHVGQYRTGMTVLGYLCSALRGYMNSRYEKAAFAVQERIKKDLGRRRCRSPN
jgi:Domain of unknown function (DUF4157)